MIDNNNNAFLVGDDIVMKVMDKSDNKGNVEAVSELK